MRSTRILASFLAVIPIISASPTRPLAARRATPTIVDPVIPLPENGRFALLNCFIDSPTARLLDHPVTLVNGGTTLENCLGTCRDLKLPFGGIENGGSSCFCGKVYRGFFTNIAPLTQCQDPCVDDTLQACGAKDRILIYQYLPKK